MGRCKARPMIHNFEGLTWILQQRLIQVQSLYIVRSTAVPVLKQAAMRSVWSRVSCDVRAPPMRSHVHDILDILRKHGTQIAVSKLGFIAVQIHSFPAKIIQSQPFRDELEVP